jgi:DNA mismatch endonuclease, patch repair protein
MDVLNKSQRSYNMSQIRAKNTTPEIKLRKALFRNGLRGYKIHYNLEGKPDIVFTKYKIAIFIDGCFWHKCPKCFVEPKTRTDYWLKKIEKNKQRDKIVNKKLKNEGWFILRFWEHQIEKEVDNVLGYIQMELKKINAGQNYKPQKEHP